MSANEKTDDEQKPNWWQKWGTPLVFGVIVLLFLIGAAVMSASGSNSAQSPSIYKDQAGNIDTPSGPYVSNFPGRVTNNDPWNKNSVGVASHFKPGRVVMKDVWKK